MVQSKTKQTLQRLLGAAAVLPAAQMGAEAAVLQSAVVNLPLPATLQGVYINVITGATGTSPVSGWDLNPYASSSSRLAFFTSSVGGNRSMRVPGVTTGSQVATVTPGILVDANQSYFTGPGMTIFDSNPGNWALNANNYFGFSFRSEGNSNSVHYGYGIIAVGTAPEIRTLVGVWYEDQANVGITVGDTGQIPEPSTAALLAVGVAGLAALRARRKRVQSEE